MEQQLTLRQSQRVVMTPALQQAIQLLQLSAVDLQQVVQRELLENPLLEESPESAETVEETLPATGREEPVEAAADLPPPSDPRVDDPRLDIAAMADDVPHARSLVAEEERSEQALEGVLSSARSLSDHLDEQLRLSTDDALALRLGRAIIGNLDDDGYLRADLDDIARGCDADPADVARLLAVIQTFDPPGVGARSVQECLLLQLRAAPEPDALALAIVEHHFVELSRRRYGDLAKALGVTPGETSSGKPVRRRTI